MIDEFVKKIKTLKQYKELNKDIIVSKTYSKSKYPHLTFKIDNLSDYMNIITLLSKTVKNDSFINGEIIYRGMANAEWDLKPTLGRYINVDELLEYNLVNRFINLSPSEFADINTSFDLLSKMQHYGLPTRLLDFTNNPLVALFFACNDDTVKNKDARVLCHRAYLKIAQDEIIENVCGLYRYTDVTDESIDTYIKDPHRYLINLYRISSDRLMVARPAVWNKRIQNQQAVFVVFSNRIKDVYALWAYGGKVNYPHIWGQERFASSLEIVQNEPLEEIYPNAWKKDFYITHETITKLFDYYIKHDYSKLIEWTEPFKGRFYFDSKFELIDDYTMKNEFCSIIVENKNKKKILNQLKQVGIEKAFVYPELQYVAEKVKDMYAIK